MTVIVGSYGLIEDAIEWHISAGADSYAGPFTLTSAVPPNDPIDLTGYTGACELRTKAGETLLATTTVTITPLTGTVLVYLPSAVSAMWTADIKKAVFDIELYAPDGTVTLLGRGTALIAPNVTTGI